VIHPALADCPGHQYWKRDFTGSSGLFSFILTDPDEAAANRFVESLNLFAIGYSWGGYESLALPADPNRWRTVRRDKPAGVLIRLHIGLEDPDDLIADLDQGLNLTG
jgi:cystathionine beta-lyase